MAALALPSFLFPFCPKLPSTSRENFRFVVSFFSSYLASPPLRSSPVDRPSAISLRRHRSLPRASSEGTPAELAEDSKFVPLNADDPVYGPPALLLVGFEADEKEKIQMFLKELDGDFLKVIYCTENMIEKTVWDAMHTEQVHLDDVKIAKSLPRLCILSGLSGEEMIMFIDAFPETGLQQAVFAALVPNSADKLLQEVINEIIGDHEMLVGKQSN